MLTTTVNSKRLRTTLSRRKAYLEVLRNRQHYLYCTQTDYHLRDWAVRRGYVEILDGLDWLTPRGEAYLERTTWYPEDYS